MEMRTQGPRSSSIGTSLKQSLKNLPANVRSAAERPETFWQRQQATIRSRIAIEQASQLPWTGLVWITALALVIVASLALRTGSRLPTRQQPAARMQIDPDQELLLAVEQSVYNGVPDALEPAAMLADDMNSVAQSIPLSRRSSSRSRDHGYP